MLKFWQLKLLIHYLIHLNIIKLKENCKDYGKIKSKITFMLEDQFEWWKFIILLFYWWIEFSKEFWIRIECGTFVCKI